MFSFKATQLLSPIYTFKKIPEQKKAEILHESNMKIIHS